MDVILDYLDHVLLDGVYNTASQLVKTTCAHGRGDSHIPLANNKMYICGIFGDPALWQRHDWWRQSISIFFILWLASSLFYLFFGAICYHLNFDKSLKRQPKFRPNQIRSEIATSLWTLLVVSALTVPIFVAQVRGLGKLYAFGTGSPWYELAQYPLFLLFSDACMYWLHRAFHHPVLFKISHHKHHSFVIPTPFSAFAMDPVEAWVMSLPIYAYSFIWPMSDVGQLVVFFLSNVWTYLLHDSRDQFHTVHHKSVHLNFGQVMPLWDKLGGTYADPEVFFKPFRDRREKLGF